MFSWLTSLFTTKKTRRRKHKLTDEQERNAVTDYMINQMRVVDIATKYGVSTSKIYSLINAARRFQ